MSRGSALLIISLGSAAALAAAAAYCRRSSINNKRGRSVHWKEDEDQEGLSLSFFQKMSLRLVSTGQDQMNYVILLDSSSAPSPTVDELQRALETLKREDEALSAALIHDGKGKPVRIASNEKTAKISGVITVVHDQAWQDVLAECRNTIHFPTPPRSRGMVPTWKLFYVPEQGAIVFVFHHLLFDGTSVKRLHTALLDVLNEKWASSANGDSSSRLRSLTCVHQAYPLDSFPARASWRVVLEMLHRVGMALRYKNSTWLASIESAGTNRTTSRTCQVFFHLTEDQTDSLLRACKDRKITVHSALTTAVSVAIATLWAAPKGILTPIVRSRHMISRWGCLPTEILTKKNLLTGLFIGTATIDVPVEEDRWSMAGRVHLWLHDHPAAITRPTSNMKHYFKIRQLIDRWWYGATASTMRDALQTGGEVVPVFAITNLGIMKASNANEDRHRISALYGCSSRHVDPNELGVLFVQTVNGRMHLSWNYASGVCNEKRAVELTRVMTQVLADMGGFGLERKNIMN